VRKNSTSIHARVFGAHTIRDDLVTPRRARAIGSILQLSFDYYYNGRASIEARSIIPASAAYGSTEKIFRKARSNSEKREAFSAKCPIECAAENGAKHPLQENASTNRPRGKETQRAFDFSESIPSPHGGDAVMTPDDHGYRRLKKAARNAELPRPSIFI
jgi:hypothetical protein